ncbi:MAG: aminoacyl-tRNA hydrolase [Candidatus Krumholzibacteriales bacterium]
MDRISYLCGLGNPGSEYDRTRHNLGFDVLDSLARKIGAAWKNADGKAEIADWYIDGREVLLVKPLTYVNLSGTALRLFPGIEPSNLLVICDDINLDLGSIRIRRSGGSGGHNGLESIENYLGSRDYPRLRIGIGPPPDPSRWKDFVLGSFTGREEEIMEDILSEAVEAVETVILCGVREAMQRFNRRGIE